MSQALKYEKNLNYYVEDGRYWREENYFCRDELKIRSNVGECPHTKSGELAQR